MSSESMRNALADMIADVPGWLTFAEAWMLHEAGRRAGDEPTVVEIGSWKGRSTIALAQGLRVQGSGRVYAIDPHDGEAAAPALGSTYESFLSNVQRAGVEDLVEPLVMPSHNARALFAERTVDVLFIDGSHEYEDVLQDVLDWVSALSDQAVVVFNDPLRPGVNRVLREEVVRPGGPFHNPRYVDNSVCFEFARDRATRTLGDPKLLRLRVLLGVGGAWGRIPRSTRHRVSRRVRRGVKRLAGRLA